MMQNQRVLGFIKSKLLKQSWRIAATVLVASAIFALGLGVGKDQITFSANGHNQGLPDDLDYSSVESLYDLLKANYDGELNDTVLLDGIKSGLVNAVGDPYTVYLNPEKAAELEEELSGTFSGIGAEIGKNDEGSLIIVAPIEGFPAEKAGLRPQDVIVAIDGQPAIDITIEEAVSRIRGPKGTNVELRILRSSQEDKTFTITRDDINIPSVKHQIIDNNIGHLQLFQFGNETSKFAQTAASEFKDKGVKGVILDLRGNPGGLLESSVEVASLWLDRGDEVLQQRSAGHVVSVERASGNNILAGIPTVVLINAGSASASEIVAGALKDNGVATVIGTKSFGKGSVQQLESLAAGGDLKVTIARWFRPNGDNIDKKGIEPDQTIDLTEEDFANGRDPQKDAAVELLR